MDSEKFEKLVMEGLDVIPERFLEKLENVAIIIEQEPKRGSFLLGLYEGVPQTKRGYYAQALPDKITIFKGPIERLGRNDEEVKKIVRDTVWHEIAHHFGLDERRVRKAEKNPRH